MTRRFQTCSAAVGVCVVVALTSAPATAQPSDAMPLRIRADAVVDLTTPDGTALVNGRWRTMTASVVEVEGRGPGPDLRPSGAPVRSLDITPRAGAADFDDRRWEPIDPAALLSRRAAGRLSFQWYRIDVTVPARVGDFDTAGSTVVFEIVVDDYAEVWVDGRLPRQLGTGGGPFVGGFNVPNRVTVARQARPGDTHRLAVFAINGPLSDPPENFIWVRSATLDFYGPAEPQSAGTVIRLDPAIDTIVPATARIERLATGFEFTEGPVWTTDGSLLFSDPNANTIYRWAPQTGVSIFRTKSGYSGVDIARYKQPGSNGLTFDREGRLTTAEHGNRRITRTERTGAITVVADRYQGRRLNSPNDLVYRSDGSLYFTDPPFGLPQVFDDPTKELSHSGVYRWAEGGGLTLLTAELGGPNGLAFSPDERWLYVGNWDDGRKVVMRYPVLADGTLGPGTVFVDLTTMSGGDAIDGVKVDTAGNVYVSGPGGLWIFSADGRALGTIVADEHPHNMAFGDDDGRTLYMSGLTGVYRIRLAVEGIRPAGPTALLPRTALSR